jgi:hypothetical protein
MLERQHGADAELHRLQHAEDELSAPRMVVGLEGRA